MKYSTLAASLILIASQAFAQASVARAAKSQNLETEMRMGQDGNGGDGLYIGNQLYVLDLVEAGVEDDPFIDMNIEVSAALQKRVETKLDPARFPSQLVARKFAEIYKQNRFLAIKLLQTLELYSWRLVNSALLNIKDENSPLQIPAKNLVQLAARVNATIRIDESLWKKLDASNRAALIFHELLYAIVEPNYVKDPLTGDFVRDPYTGQPTSAMEQSSPRAREVNGYIFSTDLERLGSEAFIKMLDHDFSRGNNTDLIYEEEWFNSIFFQLGIDIDLKDWEKSNFGVGLHDSAAKISAYVKRACEMAIAKKVVLKVTRIEEVFHRADLKSYKSTYGVRSYVEFTPLKFEMGKRSTEIEFKTRAECVQRTTQNLNETLAYINANFKGSL